jgi:phosphatidylglycerophosphate synthase
MHNFLIREQKYYLSIRKVRDKIVHPVAWFLDKIGVTANIVTYSGFLFFIFFFISLAYQSKWSIFFLFVGLLHDAFDGALSRLQHKDNDKGKFVDMLFDTLNCSVFLLALIYTNILSNFIGSLFLVVIILARILRIIYNSQILPTDWWFKPVAGSVSLFLVSSSYFLFVIYYFYPELRINYFFGIFSIIGILDSLYFYNKILKKE